MKIKRKKCVVKVLVSGIVVLNFAINAYADKGTGSKHVNSPTNDPMIHVSPAASCAGFGPQTPRDIDELNGTNKRIFSLAPDATEMNLCNIHFHKNAEHKALDFSIDASTPIHEKSGTSGGYQCLMSKHLSAAELKAPSEGICHGLAPGDTIEVHWVHSSCEVTPGVSLSACTAPQNCANPSLRVETQVFTLVNDPKALNFNDYDNKGLSGAGYYQSGPLPTTTGAAVEFTGSTTGPDYNFQCSPYQATWAVRPHCAKLNINSLGQWCKKNDFNEDHAHGVRILVTDPARLSQIK